MRTHDATRHPVKICALSIGRTVRFRSGFSFQLGVAVRRYRTEVVIPLDHEIMLHLPEDMPTGRAVIVVQVLEESDPDDASGSSEDEFVELLGMNRHDMEWWEEFEDEPVLGH